MKRLDFKKAGMQVIATGAGAVAGKVLNKPLSNMNPKLRGFMKYDSLLTGVESRSSSPVRIIRDDKMFSNIKGIIPGGEGAGYAGGIMSAAVDGIKCAESVHQYYKEQF